MSTEPQASPELLKLRNEIDSLDRQLLSLVNQRAHVAEQVGELKKQEGTAFFRPDRVAQVIEKIKSNNPGPLKGAHVAAIWREIMSACLALESPQRVAVLGPEGTFTEEAAVQYFGAPPTSCTATPSRKSSTPRPPAAPNTAWWASRTPPRAWSTARWTCSATRPATSWARSAC